MEHKWFPKNDETTVEYVIDIINSLELDIIAIQELKYNMFIEVRLS